MDIGPWNFLNFINFGMDYSTKNNLNYEFNKEIINRHILDAGPYLNSRLDYIRTSGDFEPTSEELEEHFEELHLYPKEFLDNSVADEITPKPATEQTLEKKVSEDKEISKPKIDIKFNYKTGSKQEGVEYSSASSNFSNGNLYTNFPELTSVEETQVEDILNDVKNKDINSYEDFVKAAKDLSENQKLVLLAAVGNLLGKYGYDINLMNYKVFSQDDFFEKLQDYLDGNADPIGVCRQIHSNRGKFGEDIGIRTAAVNGRGGSHMYNISKIYDDKTAILDYGNILIVDTPNIEKALEIYEKNKGSITFQHSFFDDDKFRYRLITKDGKNFLNFVGYDETSEKLKNSLIQRDNLSSPDLSFELNIEDYLTSVEINCLGFFVKAGEIRGNSNSALDKMELLQIGYNKNFLILDTINLNPSFSYILSDDGVYGIDSNLKVNTNNKEGINLASRIAGNISWKKESALFYDLVFEVGVSYKIPLKEMDIEPYLITQFALFPEDLGTYEFAPMLNEIRAGAIFNIKMPNDTDLSVEPYYLKRIWEQGVGVNAKIGNKNFGLNLEGYLTKSTYDFCPDKQGFSAGLYISPLENLIIKFNYENERTDYDGEIEDKSSFNVGAELKL